MSVYSYLSMIDSRDSGLTSIDAWQDSKCSYCAYPFYRNEDIIFWRGSGEVRLYLHAECAEQCAHHLLRDSMEIKAKESVNEEYSKWKSIFPSNRREEYEDNGITYKQ